MSQYNRLLKSLAMNANNRKIESEASGGTNYYTTGATLGGNNILTGSTQATTWTADLSALAGGGGTIGGSITDNQIAIGATTANSIEGANTFKWDASTLTMTNAGDTAITVLGNSNRSSSSSHAMAMRGMWNGTAIGTVMIQTGPDTTNKDDGRIVMYTASAGTQAERMTILHDGNVGIGTTSPTRKLHVYSSDNMLANFESSGDTAMIRVSDNDTDGQIGVKDGKMFLGYSASMTTSNLVLTNINDVVKVGIGTIAPAYNLDVVGTTQLSGNSSIVGTLSTTGVATLGDNSVTNTQTAGNNSTRIATTAFVTAAVAANTGTPGGSDTQVQYNNGGAFAGSSNMTFNGTNLTLASNLLLGSNLVHNGDTDTYIGFGTDTIDFQAGGKSFLTFTEVGTSGDTIVFNEGSNNIDFRIESDDNPNMFVMDAGNNTIGIGTAAPASNTLHIAGHGNPLRLQGTSSGKVEFGVSTSGDFTIDADDDIRLDAGGQDIALKGAGAEFGRLTNSSQDFVIQNTQNDKDIIFKTVDNTTATEVMRIDGSESRVGIGTAAPARKLEVNYGASSGYMRIVGQNRSLIIGQDSVGASVFQEDNAPLYFATNNTTRMTIAAGGNVGIGTGSPNEKLEVAPNTDVSAIIGNAVIGYNFSDYASFSHYDQRANTGGYALLQKDDGTTYLNAKSSMPINFRIENSTKFMVDGNHFRSDQTNGASMRNEVPSATNPVFTFNNDVDTGMSRAAADEISLITAGTEAIRIDSSQKVGIGTAAPAQTLDVRGTTLLSGATDTVPFEVFAYGAGTSALHVTSGSNTGLGTATPLAKLHINASAYQMVFQRDTHHHTIVKGNSDDTLIFATGAPGSHTTRFKIQPTGIDVVNNAIITGTMGVGGLITASGGVTLPATSDNFTMGGHAVNDILIDGDSYPGSSQDDYLITAKYLNTVSGAIVAAGGGGTIGGSITDNQIAVGASTANSIEGSSNLTYDGSNVNVGTKVELQGAGTSTFSAANTVFGASDVSQNTYLKVLGSGAGYTAAGIKLLTYNGADRPGGVYSYNHPHTEAWYSGPVYGTSYKWGVNYKSSIADTGSGLEVVADDANNLLMIDTAGNVGIGTTAPSEKLDVQGSILVDPSTGSDTAGTSAGIKFNAQDDSGVGWNLRLGDSSDDGDFNIDRLYSSTWYKSASIDRSTGDFIWYDDDGSTEKMRWDASTDRLGIGTSTPAYTLDVSSGYANAARLYLNEANNYIMGESDNMYLRAHNDMYFNIDTPGDSVLRHFIWRANTSSELMRLGEDGILEVKSGGKVGIGTAGPTAELDVRGASSAGMAAFVSGTGNGTYPVMHVIDSADTEVAWFEGNRAGDTGAYIGVRHWPASATENARSGIKFQSKDDGGNLTNYASILMRINDYTNGTEDGTLRFNVMADGTETEELKIDKTGLYIDTYTRLQRNGNTNGLHLTDSGGNAVSFSTLSGSNGGLRLDNTTTNAIYRGSGVSFWDSTESYRLQGNTTSGYLQLDLNKISLVRNASSAASAMLTLGDGGTYDQFSILEDQRGSTATNGYLKLRAKKTGNFGYRKISLGAISGSTTSELLIDSISTNEALRFDTNSKSHAFDIAKAGYVSIGAAVSTTDALYVNGTTTINGVLSATAKSFNIPHPLYKDKRLVHGSLEGPEHAIYIRGTIETEEKGCLVELPEYWSAMCEDYTVQLTPHGPYTVYIKEKLKDKVMIECSQKKFKFDYYIVGARTDETLEVVQDG